MALSKQHNFATQPHHIQGKFKYQLQGQTTHNSIKAAEPQKRMVTQTPSTVKYECLYKKWKRPQCKHIERGARTNVIPTMCLPSQTMQNCTLNHMALHVLSEHEVPIHNCMPNTLTRRPVEDPGNCLKV